MSRVRTYPLPGTVERADGEAFHAKYALDGDAIARSRAAQRRKARAAS